MACVRGHRAWQTKLLDPCLKGSMNVLRACVRSRSSIRRVVMTSSCSAVRYDYSRSEFDPPLDESTWSNPDYCKDHKVGRNVGGLNYLCDFQVQFETCTCLDTSMAF